MKDPGCICGVDAGVVKGLLHINEDIVAAAQRNKRKIHAEFAANAEDIEGVKKALVDAQDKVVLLRGKHAEMLKHHRRGEENHLNAADINKSATIELNQALSAGEEQECIKNLQALSNISHAIMRSSTVELERLNRKLRFTGTNLESARTRVEAYVKEYEDLLQRRDQVSEALKVEDRLMDVVSDFMQKESNVTD